MGIGGVPNKMTAIRGKMLGELAAVYKKQAGIYSRMKEIGPQEKKLIEAGRLDDLLQILEQKHTLLTKAAAHEGKLRQLQAGLAAQFEIAEFSIPRLQEAAPAVYQKELAALEKLLASFIPLLEALEKQEKENELLLNKYISRAKSLLEDPAKAARAGKAYGFKDT